jgi:hypothetical protein
VEGVDKLPVAARNVVRETVSVLSVPVVDVLVVWLNFGTDHAGDELGLRAVVVGAERVVFNKEVGAVPTGFGAVVVGAAEPTGLLLVEGGATVDDVVGTTVGVTCAVIVTVVFWLPLMGTMAIFEEAGCVTVTGWPVFVIVSVPGASVFRTVFVTAPPLELLPPSSPPLPGSSSPGARGTTEYLGFVAATPRGTAIARCGSAEPTVAIAESSTTNEQDARILRRLFPPRARRP